MKIDLNKKKVILTFPFNREIVDDVKLSLKELGIKWNPEEKFWYFNLSEINNEFKAKTFKDFIDKYEVTLPLEITAHCENIFNRFAAKSETVKKLLEIAKTVIHEPTESGRYLRNHQKYAVNWLLEDSKILADSVGVGKTMPLATVARCWQLLDSNIKVVVICPKTLIKNIELEFKDLQVFPDIYSYGKQPDKIEGKYILIADEAHLTGGDSQRSKKFLNLAADAEAVYPCSGTPMRSGRPKNLFPLLKAIRHPLADNKLNYDRRYCALKSSRFTKYDNSGASNLDELHRLTKDYILQRKKHEVLDLPSFTRVFRDIEPSAKELKIFQNNLELLKKDYYKRIKEGLIKSGSESAVFLGHVRRCASLAKISSVCELIDEIIEQGESVVVFSVYKETVQIIAHKYKFPLLTGDVIDENVRDKMVRDFQTNNISGFAATIQAGGVGITLTKANHVILIDRDWNPADNDQAEGRLLRFGQENPVTSHWIRFGTHDKHVDDILIEKSERITKVLEGKRKTMRGKSIESASHDILTEVFKTKNGS